ncbi:MAG: hypothetical protein R3C43_15815 [Chloroflexota bacterium]
MPIGRQAVGHDYFSKIPRATLTGRTLSAAGAGPGQLHEFAAAWHSRQDRYHRRQRIDWLAGDVRAIVEYNEFDALTTYLLWPDGPLCRAF